MCVYTVWALQGILYVKVVRAHEDPCEEGRRSDGMYGCLTWLAFFSETNFFERWENWKNSEGVN